MQIKFVDDVIQEAGKLLPECDEMDAFGLFDPNNKNIDPALYQSWGNDRLAILDSKYA